jgi:hypothetical protein
MFARSDGWLIYCAWPMVNIYNRLLAHEKLPAPGWRAACCRLRRRIISACFTTTSSLLSAVAYPNQDVVYGQCVLAVDCEPFVIQVPDFGKRFWVYQIVDQRTDSYRH